MFTFWPQMWYAGLNDLLKLVKEGPPPTSPKADMGSEEMWVQFAATMLNNERASPARKAVEIVSELPEFPSSKKVLDLG